MNERLKKLRKVLDLTQQEFAEIISISRNNIASYETDKSNMGDAVISLICKTNWKGRYVNEEWLRNGTGEMFLIQDWNDGRFSELISLFTSFNEDDWKSIIISIHDIKTRKEEVAL